MSGGAPAVQVDTENHYIIAEVEPQARSACRSGWGCSHTWGGRSRSPTDPLLLQSAVTLQVKDDNEGARHVYENVCGMELGRVRVQVDDGCRFLAASSPASGFAAQMSQSFEFQRPHVQRFPVSLYNGLDGDGGFPDSVSSDSDDDEGGDSDW
eukprot:3201059-Prymnesium_polylepis.2